MSALLFELRRLRKAETKRVHSVTLDNIYRSPENRDISSRINTYTDTLLRAICGCVHDTVIFETALLKSEHGAIFLRKFLWRTQEHSLYPLLPVAMYVIAPSPFLLHYHSLFCCQRKHTVVKRSLPSAFRFDKNMQISRHSAPPLHLPRRSPFLRVQSGSLKYAYEYESEKLIEPRQQPAFIMQRLLRKKRRRGLFPEGTGRE